MDESQQSNGVSDCICDICYDDSHSGHDSIRLKCCNHSKVICFRCINCLKTPICPYCRNPIDDSCIPFFNENNITSTSEPREIPENLSWNSFLSQEQIIDPYLYEDSRRMRRMMRRLRYQYRQISTTNINNSHNLSSVQRRHYNRRQRVQHSNYARDSMIAHNERNINHDELLFIMD